MRDHIVREIRRLASENGQPPGQKLFTAETGIAPHHWRGKLWARWGDALTEAGFEPNEWNAKLASDAVLLAVIGACRHYGRFPTGDEILLYRDIDPAISTPPVIRRHFGGRAGLIAALAKLAEGDPSYADIAAMLPAVPDQPSPKAPNTADGFVYLIGSGDFYKIGRSDDLERRVKQIAVALPDKAELVHSIRTDDPVGIEGYWHRRFAEKRANGEWFRLSSQDVMAFKKRKFQ